MSFIGFIGPQVDGEGLCPFCRNDPEDNTLHKFDDEAKCPLLANGNCGVMIADSICLEQDTRGHPHVYKWMPVWKDA